jgi:hypothetical protein
MDVTNGFLTYGPRNKYLRVVWLALTFPIWLVFIVFDVVIELLVLACRHKMETFLIVVSVALWFVVACVTLGGANG